MGCNVSCAYSPVVDPSVYPEPVSSTQLHSESLPRDEIVLLGPVLDPEIERIELDEDLYAKSALFLSQVMSFSGSST